jgi:D-alanyl-D-alanine carboxypeptidase
LTSDQRGVDASVAAALSKALPAGVAQEVRARIEAAPQRFLQLLSAAAAERGADPIMFTPVDRSRALSKDYAPSDLVVLDATGLSVSRPGHKLRRRAFEAMKAMDKAAREEGIVLLVSSAYRSYEYQVEVFDRHVREMGREAALKVSAEPGHSQHQLGTAIDFGSISDAFAETAASRWLALNARRFGFSLSFPKGMTEVTGYAWESWHYRYIGTAAAALEAEYFGGMQLYVLRFLEDYRP